MQAQDRNTLVTVLFVLFGGPGLVLVYLPWWITRFRLPAHEPWMQVALAGALIAAGLGPLFESIVRFVRVGRGTLVPTAPTERLVVSGLYRYVRNPMYVGVLLSLAGETFLFASEGLLLLLGAAALAMHLFVCFYEEPVLARNYPRDYPFYREHVPRWVPRLSPWRGLSQ
jgi:protein-S-isoprenylcysteine O-methyltransferase Ste14